MATSMLGLLGVFLLILGTNTSPNLPLLNVKKMAGKWYMLGTAFGAGWIETPTLMEMVSNHYLKPVAKGDLEVHSLHMTIICTRISNLFEITKTPGIFSFSGLDNKASIEVSVLEVNYGEYFIPQHKKTMNGNVTFSLRLFARKPVASLEIKNKLNQVALKQKLIPEKIIFLPYLGECK